MKPLKIIWIVFYVLTLLVWLTKHNECAARIDCIQGEVFLLLVLVMAALAFPVVYLAAALTQFLLWSAGLIGFENLGVIGGLIFWAATVVLGYLQWFVAIPFIWRKWGRSKSS